ncbi:unnamed protein product [Chondrus crispus]|uniref:Uncharacterized protein n=1 Tax=Chondrus crispus TaxID=2769 RepID=R7QC46_CHOCR|nr:unnamed protein product [Chondrus crispus]CDF35368.1 unnamed protein product [Chondrus crispus]|eukprot:XP_005715187.1 unnamed protein product [Chondrus crispus]
MKAGESQNSNSQNSNSQNSKRQNSNTFGSSCLTLDYIAANCRVSFVCGCGLVGGMVELICFRSARTCKVIWMTQIIVAINIINAKISNVKTQRHGCFWM